MNQSMNKTTVYKTIVSLLGQGIVIASCAGLLISGIQYSTMNNKEVKEDNTKYIYKADFPLGYTRLTLQEDNKDIILEKFRFNQHTRTWWDLPETDYLDAFWDDRWYNPGKDDDILTREKKNLESELKRFKGNL